jgi:hypothetical protein
MKLVEEDFLRQPKGKGLFEPHGFTFKPQKIPEIDRLGVNSTQAKHQQA